MIHLGPNSITRKQFTGDLLPVWLSGLEGIGEQNDHLTESPLKVVWPKSSKMTTEEKITEMVELNWNPKKITRKPKKITTELLDHQLSKYIIEDGPCISTIESTYPK